MKYLTIYRPYKIAELLSKAKSEKEGGNYAEAEVVNWNDAVDKYAKKGYKIVNCGTIVSGIDAIFWATLEEAQSKPLFSKT